MTATQLAPTPDDLGETEWISISAAAQLAGLDAPSIKKATIDGRVAYRETPDGRRVRRADIIPMCDTAAMRGQAARQAIAGAGGQSGVVALVLPSIPDPYRAEIAGLTSRLAQLETRQASSGSGPNPIMTPLTAKFSRELDRVRRRAEQERREAASAAVIGACTGDPIHVERLSRLIATANPALAADLARVASAGRVDLLP